MQRLHVAGILVAMATPEDADQRHVLQQGPIDRQRGNPSAGEPNNQQAAARGDHLCRQIKDVAPHRIVNHIRTKSPGDRLHAVYPIGIPIAENMIGTLAHAKLKLRVAPGRCDHPRSHCLSKLDGGCPDTACAGMDEQPLAGLQLRSVLQGEQRRLVHNGHRRGLFERHGIGNRVRPGLVDERALGKPAPSRKRSHPLPDRYATHTLAHSVHRASDLGPDREPGIRDVIGICPGTAGDRRS